MIRLLAAGALGAAAFALVVGSPRRCLPGGAATGLASALGFSLLSGPLHLAPVAAAGGGAFLASLLSELLARWQRVTAAAFLVPGLIPLVPGLSMYRAMLALLQGAYAQGEQQAAIALLWAGSVAFGIVLGSTPFRRRWDAGP
jgi:uncharacterized membrane protein YjjB (DUF3815 family)